jgi:hypothetical protein
MSETKDTLSDARDHATVQGDASRPALTPMPAPKRRMTRRIAVKVRSPFLPDHHGHARHGLKPHHD